MSALIFALWMFSIVDPYSGNAMEMPLSVSLDVYAEAVAVGVDPAVMGALLMHEHPGGGPDKFLAPFKTSSTGAVGLWQLKGVWHAKAKKSWGYEDLSWTDFAEDGALQTEIAVLVVERMTRKHAVHAVDGEHPLFAHWSCGNSARDDGVSWEGSELPQCAGSVARVERRIEATSLWRVFALPLLAIDALYQDSVGWLCLPSTEPDA